MRPQARLLVILIGILAIVGCAAATPTAAPTAAPAAQPTAAPAKPTAAAAATKPAAASTPTAAPAKPAAASAATKPATAGTPVAAPATKPAAVSTPASASSAAGARPTVRIGSTNFGEQIVLAELYSRLLEENGYTIQRKFNLGNREIVAPAIESGQIDMYPEYLATYLTFLTKDKEKASTDPAATHKNLQEALKGRNLTVLGYAPAIDTNGFVVTRETAQKYNLKKLSDLAAVNGQLVLGGPPECPDRPFCLQGLTKTYGLTFKDFKALDSGGPITVAALEGKQIDVAVLFTTDAVIAAKNFVLLEDDKHLQLADNVAPVIRNDVLEKAPADFRTLIDGATARITTEELTGMNRQVGLDKKDPREVATAWLKSKGLIK